MLLCILMEQVYYSQIFYSYCSRKHNFNYISGRYCKTNIIPKHEYFYMNIENKMKALITKRERVQK